MDPVDIVLSLRAVTKYGAVLFNKNARDVIVIPNPIYYVYLAKV